MKKKAIDAVIWTTGHIKEIGIGAGLIFMSGMCYKIGYRRCQKETAYLMDGLIAFIADFGGGEWTK